MHGDADIPAGGQIESTAFSDALSERYLAYALSTITSRSLPDVRDGLKPVHRRLLFAMRQLKLDPGQGFKKSARVVGDVMGKFHPHGDAAIYDAMVRLAQEFAMRYCLVEGQGNFGNIDGDNAAAMRYTEARMTEVSKLLLDGLTKMRLISDQPTMARPRSLHYYRRVFQICLLMGRKALPLGWQHRCLRIILSSLPMRHCI